MKNVFHITYLNDFINENAIISFLLIIVKRSIKVFLVLILKFLKIKKFNLNKIILY